MDNTIFYNSDYLVIEYIDLIKSPYFTLLKVLPKNNKIKEILKTELIEPLSDTSLVEWYINRKYQNFMMDLNRYPEQISEETMNKLLEEQICLSPKFYQYAAELPMVSVIKTMKTKKINVDIIIYHPHKNSFAKDDLANILNGSSLTFMDNFDDVLDKAKENSTYILSDISKILRMKEKGYLKHSSVTLPIEYRYNKKSMTEFKIDLEKICHDNIFKYSFMRACTVIPE